MLRVRFSYGRGHRCLMRFRGTRHSIHKLGLQVGSHRRHERLRFVHLPVCVLLAILELLSGTLSSGGERRDCPSVSSRRGFQLLRMRRAHLLTFHFEP